MNVGAYIYIYIYTCACTYIYVYILSSTDRQNLLMHRPGNKPGLPAWQASILPLNNIEQVLAATPHKIPTIRPLAPIMKTIQVRWTIHAGHCRRSKDELISDVLLWTPAYGQAKVGRPAWTYIQQLCEDTGCRPEDQPKVMNNREEWRERVRDICASSTTWWWWWWRF